jgi:hypothetical protein
MSKNKIYNRLKDLSFNPQYIIDCGACCGEWSNNIRSVFNDSTILAVDASDWSGGHFPSSTYSEIEVLSDKDNDEIIFYKKVEGMCTGDSIFKEDTFHYAEHNTIKETRLSKTLKTLCEKNQIPRVDLLKLDTQGSEILIMKGLGDMLNNVEFVEIECSLVEYNLGGCLIGDVIEFMKDKFIIYEIIDFHRHYDLDLIQIDIIFQNKNSKIKKQK